MMRWFTSDWHLGDDRFKLMGRPFTNLLEMHQTIVDNFNSLVKYDDDVYFLGDAVYKPESLEQLSSFNGNKVLIRGNHDRQFSYKQLGKYFDTIVEEGGGINLEIKGIPCYLTHYPTRGLADKFNLVGHIHGAWKVQKNMLNVGVDAHHFFPLNEDTIEFYYNAINQAYDQDVWVGDNAINVSHNNRGKAGSNFQ